MPPTTETARRLAALQQLGFSPAVPADGNTVRLDRHSVRVHRGLPALGSYVDVTAIASSGDHGAEAIGLAFAELDRLAAVFNRHDGASALAALNDAGRLGSAPAELTRLLARGRRFTIASGGAFDVTVGPLVDLFRGAAAQGRELAPAEIAERRELVGCGRIAMAGARVVLARRGMTVTLDGIAKGAIVDAMAAVLERHRITRWLVNAGGDLRAAGANERGEPWLVAVRDPAGSAALPEDIRLRDAAIATSGGGAAPAGTVRDVTVDGASGAVPNECASATVLAPSAAAADALATAVIVAGPRAGIALVERLRCACLVVLADGRPVRSGNWKETTG